MKKSVYKSKKAILSFAVFTAALFFVNCITPPKMVDVAGAKNKSVAERETEYKYNAITPGNMFAPYKVGEAQYPAEQLSPLFTAPYVGEPARDKYSSGNTWNTFATIFAAAGGGLIGWNAGTALAGREANVGIWIGGGASLVLGFVFGGIADGKYTDASKLYNDDLRKALDLQQKTAAVRPQEQFQHYVVSYGTSF